MLIYLKYPVVFQVCRHEYISLLAQLANKFPAHPVLADFAKLINHEDVEVDFFENIKHVQVCAQFLYGWIN